MEITDIDSLTFTNAEKRLVKRTIFDNPYIPITPFKRQLVALLLANKLDKSPVDLMFGGAAGGAKTATLSILAAQYLGEPEYRCLVMRENYKDLVSTNSIFDNLKSWVRREELGPLKCKVRETSPIRIKAPSGAEIHFNSFDDVDSREKMRGEEYQRIIVDEMTQIPKPVLTYRYRSLRKTKDNWIPLSTIGGTNPNYSETNDYVTDKYVLPEAPDPYLPMSFKHNPHINTKEYTKQLLQLDPIDIEYQLHGNFLYKPSAGDLISRDVLRSRVIDIEDYSQYKVIFNTIAMDLAGEGKDQTSLVSLTLFENGAIVVTDITTIDHAYPEDEVYNFLEENYQAYYTNSFIIEKEPGSDNVYSTRHWKRILQDLLYRGGIILKEAIPSKSKFNRARPVALAVNRGELLFNKELKDLERKNGLFDQFINISPDKEEMKKRKSPDILDALGYALDELRKLSKGGVIVR